MVRKDGVTGLVALDSERFFERRRH